VGLALAGISPRMRVGDTEVSVATVPPIATDVLPPNPAPPITNGVTPSARPLHGKMSYAATGGALASLGLITLIWLPV
jgi:hypothetical protein